jgi:dsRNA-specific ribonuclease
MNNPYNTLITNSQVEDILNFYGNIGGKIESPIRLKINQISHYQKAFTHESYYQSVRNMINSSDDIECFTNYTPTESSERLEYLGDHILKAVIGRYLYERYPNEREGFLTDLKIKIEKCSMLHKIAQTLGFKRYLMLSLSVENQTLYAMDKGRNTPSYYEDAFEAFVGAILEDFGEDGYKYADRFVRNLIENIIDFAQLNSVNDNYKDVLVKKFIALKWPKPRFISIDETSTRYLKKYPKILVLSKSLLTKEQVECLQDYTVKIILSFKGEEKVITRHISKDLVIAGLGFGRKNIQSEQECSRQALVNLKFV